jgi:hypothetical protein
VLHVHQENVSPIWSVPRATTNRRRTVWHASPIWYPPPNGHPSCRLHPRGSQDLVATLYLHKQHTEDTHAHRWRSHIQLYLPIKYYTKCIDQINQYHLTQSLSINYYTKSNCHLIQSLWLNNEKWNSPFWLMTSIMMNSVSLSVMCSRLEPCTLIKAFS